MKIVIIGAGHLAYHLVKMLTASKVPILQLYNRSRENAEIISRSTNVGFTCDSSCIENADVYIIATSDHAIGKASRLIHRKNVLVVHTSGSATMGVLEGDYRKGVFYPLQSFRRERALSYHKIPFFIESEKEQDAQLLVKLAQKISNFVYRANAYERAHLHLAAVWGANFVNHCIGIAQKYCKKAKMPSSIIQPLLEETLDKIQHLSPEQAQTGPALRAETKIIEKHLDMIQNKQEKLLYQLLTESIRNYHEKLQGNP